MKKNRLIVVAVFVLLLLSLGCFWIFSWLNQPKVVNSYVVKTGDISEKISLVGQIVPATYASVKTALPGRVAEIDVHEGDTVTQGQKLLLIHATPTPADLLNVRHEINVTEDQLKYLNSQDVRYFNLLKTEAGTHADSENWHEQFMQASHDLNYYQALLNYYLALQNNPADQMDTTVTSPINGQVIKIFIRPGDTIEPATASEPGSVLFLIADMNSFIFRSMVSQEESVKVNTGMKANIVLSAFPQTIFPGLVASKNLLSDLGDNNASYQSAETQDIFKPEDPYQHGVEVDIGLSKISDTTPMIIGYLGSASIEIAQKSNALVIPWNLVYFDSQDQPYVWLCGENYKNNFLKKSVSLGISNAEETEVLTGLQVGQKICAYDAQ